MTRHNSEKEGVKKIGGSTCRKSSNEPPREPSRSFDSEKEGHIGNRPGPKRGRFRNPDNFLEVIY
ncbi:hypothetical protein AKJ54_00750 [candidate division MSBL1 archaeon SCGC-AAA382K21]|uniref:Uncharacterized protein n=1 Tax=candidate division MSBL1 archaeon SCGC-AAA382K21 TaxID=1698283 RepID=A0A133VL28_9EURY|nr:hypothetical protein AKJ54_00750 [candidate division MSBL1 archaeon SCGC-AAA382K21]